MPVALLALLLLLLAPARAPAQAPTLELRVAPDDGVEYGRAHELRGRLLRAGAPVTGQAVVIEARRFPYREAFALVRTVTTDAAGRFAVRRRFDRNHQLRASVAALGALSPRVVAYVFPRTELTYAVVRTNVLRLTQTYATPPDVRLTRPTLFYLGRRGARTAPLRARAATRRTRPGRFVSRATVRVPERYRGRFQYASCFRYDRRAGMGDPSADCPRRAFRFE